MSQCKLLTKRFQSYMFSICWAFQRLDERDEIFIYSQDLDNIQERGARYNHTFLYGSITAVWFTLLGRNFRIRSELDNSLRFSAYRQISNCLSRKRRIVTCFIPKNMTIILTTEKSQLFFRLESNICARWDILLVRTKTREMRFDLAKKENRCLPFPKFSGIISFPNGCILGYPRLYALPENLFR